MGANLRELSVDEPIALPAGRFSARTALGLTLEVIWHEPLIRGGTAAASC